MSFVVVALSINKTTGKSNIEIVFEQYAKHLVKVNGLYLKHQIDSLCQQGISVPDSYVARVVGYYTVEEAMRKLETGQSELANQIVALTYYLHDEDDYMLIEIDKPILANRELSDELP